MSTTKAIDNSLELVMEDLIEFRILNEKDEDQVWDIIMAHYTTGDPVLTISEFSTEDIRKMLGKAVKDGLSQRVSVGAFDNITKKLVAIRMSWLGRLRSMNKEATDGEDLNLPLHVKQQISLFEFFLEKDLSATLGTEDYMRYFVLCTRPEYSRHGIAKELYKRSEEIARREGCRKIVTIATSAYALKLTKKFGFITEKSIAFKKYVDPFTKTKIFENLPEPHTMATLEVKYLF